MEADFATTCQVNEAPPPEEPFRNNLVWPSLTSGWNELALAAQTSKPSLLIDYINAPAHEEEQEALAHCARGVALFSPGLLKKTDGHLLATHAFNFASAVREKRSDNMDARREVVLVTLADQLAAGNKVYRPRYNEIFQNEANPATRQVMALKCMHLHRHVRDALLDPADPWQADLARRLQKDDPQGYAFWTAGPGLVNPSVLAGPAKKNSPAP